MAISQKELGERLKEAREACGMRQEDVARRLKVSRSTVAQMELGNRAVSSIELERLAYLYGRHMGDFFEESFSAEDVLVALFRAHPDVANERQVVDPIRSCLALGRETTNLERLLSIQRDVATVASYIFPAPPNKWAAIQQGRRIADDERRRLGLGIAPLPSLTELLETQGIRTAQVKLPADVSGLTLADPTVGLFVAVNREHPALRQRFSYAHEYCHVLADRTRRGTISRDGDRDSLLEVRANAFAAGFLMPEEGVRQFVEGLGKGRPSRLQEEVYDEADVVRVQARSAARTQEIEMYDVARIAHHFRVSRLSTIYRLRNLRLITDSEVEALRTKEESGVGSEVAKLLGLKEPSSGAPRDRFRPGGAKTGEDHHRFLGLGLEALRRELISRRKLEELAQMVDVRRDTLFKLLRETGLDGCAVAG